jgi:hypothetical protein
LKQSLNKSITAKKLHRRTMTPLPEPEVTIPFGAIVDNVKIDRDTATFEYLMEPYSCGRELFVTATGGAAEGGEAARSPAAALATASSAASPEPVKLHFETLASSIKLSRAKVPGGWLLATPLGSIAFYPDPNHQWNGESL